MNKSISSFLSIALLAFVMVFAVSCNEDEPPLPDNLVTFESSEVGMADDEDDVTISLNLSRAVSSATTLQVTYTAQGVVYGEDFTINPAPAGNTFSVTIPENSATASFTVTRTTTRFLEGTESIAFEITDSGDTDVLPGETATLTLSFSAIVSAGAQLTLQGKTDVSNYTNTVYADLSGNTQSPADRKSWNLAFYGGSEFKVVLNPNNQTTAAALTKTDITTVTVADASTILNLNHDVTDPATLALVDYYDGSLSKLVFADVSANESENKVYLVSFEGNKATDTWYKVKVNRNGTGYRVHYALIGETTIKTLDVAKNAEYNFTFASLVNNAVVSVEPRKANWDISWGYSTYMSVATDVNSAPYWYQDFVALNSVAGVQAAEVAKADATEAAAAYTSFGESDLTGLTFLQTRDAIGSKWRVTIGTGIKRDRFYVIKDARGNYYKLKFVSMGVGNDGGERGRPVIEYALVKKAED